MASNARYFKCPNEKVGSDMLLSLSSPGDVASVPGCLQ